MDNIKQIKQLLNLFDKREQVYVNVTGELVNLIGPTALNALYELFETDDKNIIWIDIQLMARAVIIIAAVTYKAGDPVPEIIERLSPMTPIDLDPGTHIAEVQRMMRVGIPLDIVFYPTEEILKFLRTHISNQVPSSQDVPTAIIKDFEHSDVTTPIDEMSSSRNSPTDFNIQALTQEQIEQLVFFQYQTKGTKH